MATCIHGTHWDGVSPFWCPQCSTGISHAVSTFTIAVVAPLTHRPSRLDPAYTACGERLTKTHTLQLGEGETCERCTHVVAQVAAALRGEPSWAQKM